MNDELEKKMEELLSKYKYEHPSVYRSSGGIGFEAGFQSCHDLMKKDYDAKVQKLVEQVREYADLHHAPKLEEALAEFEK